jgi:outer membrane biosynthesis protein TonB
MKRNFRYCSAVIVAVHAALALIVLTVTRLQGCSARPEKIMPVALHMEVAPALPHPDTVEPSPESEPSLPDPSPVPDPTPVDSPPPDPPVPSPDPPPPPDPPPAKKRIQVSDKRVTREIGAQKKPVFPDDVVRQLEKKLTAADAVVTADEHRASLRRVRDALHGAWLDRPSREEAGDAVATVTIRFDGHGRILDRALTGPSGNAALDTSVMRAVGTVARIAGLSEAFLEKQNYLVRVAFRLE